MRRQISGGRRSEEQQRTRQHRNENHPGHLSTVVFLIENKGLGDGGAQGQPWLYNQNSLGCMRPCLKNRIKKKKKGLLLTQWVLE